MSDKKQIGDDTDKGREKAIGYLEQLIERIKNKEISLDTISVDHKRDSDLLMFYHDLWDGNNEVRQEIIELTFWRSE